MALTRRKAESFEGAEVEQLRNLERSRSSRFRRAFSQSSKASSWVSLAEAESLPDPEGISPCSCTADDFDVLDKLGAGSCGSVSKVSHKFTGEDWDGSIESSESGFDQGDWVEDAPSEVADSFFEVQAKAEAEKMAAAAKKKKKAAKAQEAADKEAAAKEVAEDLAKVRKQAEADVKKAAGKSTADTKAATEKNVAAALNAEDVDGFIDSSEAGFHQGDWVEDAPSEVADSISEVQAKAEEDAKEAADKLADHDKQAEAKPEADAKEAADKLAHTQEAQEKVEAAAKEVADDLAKVQKQAEADVTKAAEKAAADTKAATEKKAAAALNSEDFDGFIESSEAGFDQGDWVEDAPSEVADSISEVQAKAEADAKEAADKLAEQAKQAESKPEADAKEAQEKVDAAAKEVAHDLTKAQKQAEADVKKAAEKAAADAEAVEMKEKHLHDHIEREVAIQKQLKHPNIVQLYEYFEDKEHVYLLLEFAADGSLFSKIHQQNCLSHAEAASVFTDVSEALAHLHRHGIAHRDLKPENVLLFPGGRAKLADFGWCAQLTSDGRKTFCGTMDYLSPEMVSQEPHDHRVDIWALGVLLYEMLTGDPPFAGRNNAHVLGRILSVDIIMPVSIPEGAADLIHALLKASPQERLTLDAALKWAWLKDMRTDPLETEEEVAIPVDALECSESTERLLLEVPSAMHLYPQPKSSSRRNSPRAELGEGAGWLPCKLGEPDVLNPGQPFLLARQSSKSFKGSKSKDCFGSALRPYQANWEVPSCEAASGLSPDHCAAGGPKEKGSFAGGAFLLSSCLKPASGLQLRHEDSSLSLCGAVPKVQSWADTDLYVSVRSWVRQAEPALSYGKEVDPALSMSKGNSVYPCGVKGWKASGSEVARRQHNSSLDSSLACSPPQSLSTFSESSQLSFDCVDSVDADAATDTEGDARNLAMPFYTEGCTTKANATKARVIK